MSNQSLNPWMLATAGMLLVGATVGATLLAGRDSNTGLPDSPTAQTGETQAPALAPQKKMGLAAKAAPVEYQRIAAGPSQSTMATCNQYADEQVNSKTEEVLTSAVLGAAIGAAVGAAGGAIAGGGSGAGKGAAIGGLTGAAGGSLYGLNENKTHDAQYKAAYSSCMRSKGYHS